MSVNVAARELENDETRMEISNTTEQQQQQPGGQERQQIEDDAKQYPTGFNSGIYALFFTLGIGSLFPWNAFISENQYFATRFCGSSIAQDFESVFSVAYNVTNLCALLLLVRVQHSCSEAQLVLPPAFVTAIVFVLMSAISLVVDVPSTTMFHLTVVLVVMSGACSAPFIAGICAIGAQFPEVYLSAIFSGQAFAGVLVSATGWLTTWATTTPSATTGLLDVGHVEQVSIPYSIQVTHGNAGNTSSCEVYVTDWGAFSYFVVAVCAAFACVGSYLALKRHPTAVAFQRHFARQAQATTTSDNSADTTTGDLRTSLLSDTDAHVDNNLQSVMNEHDVSSNDVINQASPLRSVLWQVRWFAFSVWFNFAISLALFPAVVSAIKPVVISSEQQPSRLLSDLWLPTLFLVFNCCDFVSRVIAGRFQLISRAVLPHVCIARALLVPLFLATNIHVGTSQLTPEQGAHQSNWDFLSSSNAMPVLLTILLGLSNGYCQSLAMMFGPQAVHPKDSDTASTVMVFALTLGLSCGSLMSFVLV